MRSALCIPPRSKTWVTRSFLDMADGLGERLEREHQDLLLAVAEDETELEIHERLFRGGRVDAVIVPNTRVQDPRVDFLLENNYPFVGYGRTRRLRALLLAGL